MAATGATGATSGAEVVSKQAISRVEMTYRDGRVVVTLTSYSLSSPSNIEVVTHELTLEGFEDWLASRPQWEQDNMMSFAQQKD